ncbi:class A beta-lactamase [Kitasatospora sp. CM 4170]|uniref:Beta-lactamase n=1 Tax=Kitasatospora aburaviensis TaxID=67265 RepID=A0ABW1FAZ5_9ACTN|nr:class A beta-lactamase [Kitasatospora sp. CM 4170]WNM43769.1 class A beta-lactamase [Kitasatospora sp. CM 4170]
METTGARRSRRAVLALGAGTALAAGLALAGRAHAAPAPAGAAAGPDATLCAELAGLEREYGARLGLFAHDTGTGRTLAHRADELFPLCSVFKPLAAAAVLRDLDRDGEFLARRIHYTEQDVKDSGYGPVTKDHLATGMTVEELCAAAVGQSDNAAANLLLRELGGPTAVTRFCRSIGDGRTRLDRWEPELNSAEPWRSTDTTTPRAVARTFARVLLGDVLEPRDRARLTGWMIANTTNTDRFRAGFPADWVLADKTGGGSAYGVSNDVGVVRPPNRKPIVVAVHTTTWAAAGPQHNEMVKRAAELVAGTLT